MLVLLLGVKVGQGLFGLYLLSLTLTLPLIGPTALSYILHSTPTLPIANLSEFDHANGFSMRFSPSDPSVDGDGFILVTTETTTSSTVYGQAVEPPPYVFEALHSPSWKEVVNRLAMTFIDHISPFMPVVVRGEMDEVGQLALYAMAGVAAARRDCPREIFDCLRYIIMQEIHDRGTFKYLLSSDKIPLVADG